MNRYRQIQKSHRRGEYCIAAIGVYGLVCGCGTRTEPRKSHKNRIVRRVLKRELEKEMKEL